jgi:hypothetical protein
MPVLTDAPAEVKEAADNVNQAKVDAKAAAATLKVNEAVIFDYVKPIQDREGYAHCHSKSYEVPGNEGSVKFVSANKFSVSGDDEENLVELLGQDGFDKRFEKNESLSAKAVVFKNEELQAELMELLGDKFSKFFEYNATLKVKADFDKMQYELNEDDLADMRVLAKQAKPALK